MKEKVRDPLAVEEQQCIFDAVHYFLARLIYENQDRDAKARTKDGKDEHVFELHRTLIPQQPTDKINLEEIHQSDAYKCQRRAFARRQIT
jgi:hypothetical protein